MSEDKPLRHEEYQAMAEELRQKTEENKKLRARLDKKRPINWGTVFYVLRIAGAVAVLVAGLFLAVSITASVIKKHSEREAQEKLAHPKFEQKYPCYFVRHNRNWEDQGDELFQKWHVYKANSDCDNRTISLDTEKSDEPTFDTKIEAWKWAAEKYHLEMCK